MSPLHLDDGILCEAAQHIHHPRQRISRNQLLKYLLLATVTALSVITLGLQIRSRHIIASIQSTSTPHPLHSALLDNTTAISTPQFQSSPRIGKLTASFGPPSPIYLAALSTHTHHNTLFSYPSSTLHTRILPGLWSKHAHILTHLGAELSKPASQRLHWLMWHDRDTILTNPSIPLTIFLPPEPAFASVNLVVARDRNGLNNGVFFIRVSEWGVRMFASALSVREYEPSRTLRYSEQSAMEAVIERPSWSENVAYVPQRWFNGFPPAAGKKMDANSLAAAREGSLLVHFASDRDGRRAERMQRYLAIAGAEDSGWNRPLNETGYLGEIEEYWTRVAKGEKVEDICADIGRRAWN